MNQARLILFDLDGTLVDTAIEIAEAVNRTLAEARLAPLAPSLIRDWIGKGTAWLFGNALASTNPHPEQPDPSVSERFAHLYPRFLQHYADLTGTLSLPYPGAAQTLTALRAQGRRLAVVTNKERSLSLKLLHSHQLLPLLDWIVAGGDTPAGKPSPLPLLRAMELAQLGHHHTLFVGDSSNDVQAARAAHIPVWTFNHGYNHGEPITLAAPDRVIDSFSELLSCLNQSVTPSPPELVYPPLDDPLSTI